MAYKGEMLINTGVAEAQITPLAVPKGVKPLPLISPGIRSSAELTIFRNNPSKATKPVICYNNKHVLG